MLAQASVVLHHARTFTGPTTTASLHIWVTDTHTPVFVYSSICIYTHQFLINIYNYIYIYKHILNSSTDTVTNKPRDCHHCILIPEEFLTVVKSFEVNQPTPLIAYNATHCHARIDRSSYKTAKLMNSENTDIMYLDFSNALHQVPHKISFAWSIQIGLDMSTATQFNKRQIKASWQSSNKTRRLEYLQIWNSSYHLLFINHFFIQENLSKICHKISMGSTWTNVTFTRRDTTWCSCALLRSQLQWSALTAHYSCRIPASHIPKSPRGQHLRPGLGSDWRFHRCE